MTLYLNPDQFIHELWNSSSEYEFLRSGKAIMDEEYHSIPEDSHLISVAFNGDMGYVVNGQDVIGQSLSILWVSPYAEFQTLLENSSKQTHQLWFRFRVKNQGQIIGLNDSFCLSDKQLVAQKISNELLPNRSLSSPFWEQQRQKTIISTLISHIFNKKEPTLKKEKGLFPNQKKIVADYIHKHIHEHFTTEELARYMKLNRTYLSSQFKKSFGITLQGYIVKYRIEQAAREMLKNNYTVKEAATVMGYGSEFHFSRQFRSIMGLSPSHWVHEKRKEMRKKYTNSDLS